MRILSLLAVNFVITISPVFCQTTASQLPIANATPLLYAGAKVTASDLRASPFEVEESANPASPNIGPAVPAPAPVAQSLVQPQIQQPKPKTKEWKLSLVALAAAHSADAATSWNKREMNPLLSPGSGAFGGQTLALKCAVAVASVAVQAILMRHRPELAKTFARINFIESGIIGGTAIHNSFVPSR